MKRELPVWRSLMYVPVNVEKYVDRAHTRGADVIQLDLEDSVPPAEKANARWWRRPRHGAARRR
jgi:citrate lyase subunit beta/citryl-CoA lyase